MGRCRIDPVDQRGPGLSTFALEFVDLDYGVKSRCKILIWVLIFFENWIWNSGV